METWVLLVVVYSGYFEGKVSMVAMPSQQACEDAVDVMVEHIMPVMPDAMFQCSPTDIPVSMIRPKPRPDGLWPDQKDERP